MRIKAEGEKCVRVKGIDVPLDEGKRLWRRGSGQGVGAGAGVGGGANGGGSGSGSGNGKEKKIGGCKIEFWGEEDRRAFLECVREVQGTFWGGVK